MDALGHVNNTVYFRYFESGRIVYFERAGAGFRETGPILATASCEFLLPLTYPDTVRVEVGVTRLGTTSFTMVYRVVSLGRGALAARGASVCVWYDYRAGAKAALPSDVRARIEALEGRAP
ncbi:MAG: acyl-CoA thioesterase [Polyangiaceae bacterium]|nr:acyl-CoA thioesterase [Polyangiaceae bacterium]